MKKIAILGSTGSVGRQTLEVVSENPGLSVFGLTTNTNIDLLYEQIQMYRPKVVAVMNKESAFQLQKKVGKQVAVLAGMEGLIAVATLAEVQVVVTAVVGMIGLRPTIAAIQAGKDIALANKETLVTAGSIIMKLIDEVGVKLIPVDSEHSAIFQALQGEKDEAIDQLWLTASGGPFRGKTNEQMKEITLEQALKHPNWSMGAKITIDSATMMNKGLEVIEAKWLFRVKPNQIKVVVHPQSIIHSMVEMVDSSVIAQLGMPDMKLPIQYALFYPNRQKNNFKRLSLANIGQLTFEEPDVESFPCLRLAYEAMEVGGSMPTVLNAANEKAVELFMNRQIHFLEIPSIIESVMKKHQVINNLTIEDIIECEKWTHETIESRCLIG